MNIAITGSTGYIGTALCRHLREQGHFILPITRDILDPRSTQALQDLLAQSDAVINLAGVPINQRWTQTHKAAILNSRIQVTRTVVSAMRDLDTPPRLLISASAVGYYPATPNAAWGICVDETQEPGGEGFLADVCKAWEKEACLAPKQTRLAITRFGIVFSEDGGAYPLIKASCRRGFATVLGSGKQPVSWIDRADLIRAMDFILHHDTLQGIINLTVPEHSTYAEMMQEISLHDHTRFTIRIPSFLLELGMGHMSTMLTRGTCVIPRKLLEAGFKWLSPTIRDFLQR
ncbi:TIGR01777 family protein [Akkermansia glycaniphila]|uniref:TIGR01777 family oxidoreductase n=1 Tax=Akkermansia glycaniphila TaxID=1679444 RepID=UPI001C017437|nr:TIGR01777 family oxidoreductase [Akkermansia glycaniphila]MBT9448940.1 TIGR01777 family protein [Akkermansia glycaniphila]